jgi:DNA-binding transcriptional MerR regulator
MQSTYSIKDLERLSGIKAHTIRIWEQRHKIIEPKRTDTNIRFYCDDDLRRLLNVSYLVLNGVKISHVANLTEEELHGMVEERACQSNNYTIEINALKMAMFSYSETAFNEAFNLSIQNNGEDETFTKVLGLFISELGILWQTNTVKISHEHFISNLIKQKLFSAIDQCQVKPRADKPSFLLYLPSNELHEISLLYLAYLLKRKGAPIICMGQNTPGDYLSEVYSKVQFDYAVSVFTTNPHSEDVEAYISDLCEKMEDTNVKFLFCGAQLAEVIEKGLSVPNVSLYKNVAELQQILPV